MKTILIMHTPRRKHQLSPHSLNEIQLNLSILFEFRMQSFPRGEKRNSIRLFSR